MRRFVIILSALLLLLGTTELHQLCRLPLLVTHYLDHRWAGKPLSFFRFLQLHYTGSHPDDRDDNEDRRLPFKTADIHHTDIPVCHALQVDLPLPWYINVPSCSGHTEGIPGQRSFEIFHPPDGITSS